MSLIYLDSGVLIAAARGTSARKDDALDLLGDRSNDFASSEYVQLEVMPKVIYHGYQRELEFYEAYFRSVSVWTKFHTRHLRAAYDEACQSGLSGFDALHLVVAVEVGCSRFITTERPDSPIHRTKLIQTTSLGAP